MKNQTHNGWTNYPTWKVNLEMIDDLDTDHWTDFIEDNRGSDMLTYNLGQLIREYVEEKLYAECVTDSDLVYNFALSFIADVNWREIAEHVLETYKENYWCDNCGTRFDERYLSNYCSSECEREYELLATHPKG